MKTCMNISNTINKNLGDFNCKIGKKCEERSKESTTSTETTKSGKLLKKMAKTENMIILNNSKKCQGKWTRIQGQQKSTIDYVIVDKKDEKYLTKMIIDEEKVNTPYHITKEGKYIQTTAQ